MSASLLEMRGVKNDRPAALKAVDLALAAREILCLSGPSGSGKTLLLRAIADLDPGTGELYLRDRRREQLSGPEWRRQVVYVAAESAWWADTPKDHFQCAPSALAQLGLQPTVMLRQVSSLSTGERQRLALLRALALTPPVLLLDEPTAALDLSGREVLLRELDAMAADPESPAMVLVTHHVEEIPPAFTHVLLMRAGVVVAAGPIATTLTDESLSEAFDMSLRILELGDRRFAVAASAH